MGVTFYTDCIVHRSSFVARRHSIVSVAKAVSTPAAVLYVHTLVLQCAKINGKAVQHSHVQCDYSRCLNRKPSGGGGGEGCGFVWLKQAPLVPSYRHSETFSGFLGLLLKCFY